MLWRTAFGIMVLLVGVLIYRKFDPWSGKSRVALTTSPRVAASAASIASPGTGVATQYTTVSARWPDETRNSTNAVPVPAPGGDGQKSPQNTKPVTAIAQAPAKASAAVIAGLSGRVLLQGTPLPEKPLPLDPGCGRLHTSTPTTRFYVTDEQHGLADVVIHVKEGWERLSKEAGSKGPALLDQVGCEYRPYVTAISTSDKLLVRNSDPLMHNVHPTPVVAGNREANRAQLPKSVDLEFQFSVPEPFLRFKCDVHPWMFAYVTVFPHSAFAVSDEHGRFQLPPLPPGTYIVEAIHRKAGRAERTLTITEGSPLPDLDFSLAVPKE